MSYYSDEEYNIRCDKEREKFLHNRRMDKKYGLSFKEDAPIARAGNADAESAKPLNKEDV